MLTRFEEEQLTRIGHEKHAGPWHMFPWAEYNSASTRTQIKRQAFSALHCNVTGNVHVSDTSRIIFELPNSSRRCGATFILAIHTNVADLSPSSASPERHLSIVWAEWSKQNAAGSPPSSSINLRWMTTRRRSLQTATRTSCCLSIYLPAYIWERIFLCAAKIVNNKFTYKNCNFTCHFVWM